MKDLLYKSISQDQAKEMMDTLDDYIILDVRTELEFKYGHIPNAINIPNEEIEHVDPLDLEDRNKPILVYCRSGHRSLEASAKLALMGYNNIYEFGGIITWEYEITR